MEILSQHLPSGGYGYTFPSINIKPMTYLDVVGYLESVPSDNLAKYLFSIRWLAADDPNIYNCYIMDLDYLIFMKKLITVSRDLTMNVSVECPHCHKKVEIKLNMDEVTFKAADNAVMEGAIVNINGMDYNIKPPTVKEFEAVFSNYLRCRKIEDLDTIKLISLVQDFNMNPNKIENTIVNATHEDITMLMALKDLYFDRVEPIKVQCPECNKGKSSKERRYLTVRLNELIVDFFREIINNNRITGDKIKFKQTREF